MGAATHFFQGGGFAIHYAILYTVLCCAMFSFAMVEVAPPSRYTILCHIVRDTLYYIKWSALHDIIYGLFPGSGADIPISFKKVGVASPSHHAILYPTILLYTTRFASLYYTIIHYIKICYTWLYYGMLNYVLLFTTLYYSILYYIIFCSIVEVEVAPLSLSRWRI